jgi:hypothetical protein
VPRIRVTARPAPSAAVAPPPARTWVEAVRDGRSTADGRALLALAYRSRLRYARTRQYQSFLSTPDPTAPNRTTYEYTVSAATAAPVRTGDDGGGGGVPLALVLGAVVLAGGALVVLWAHL